MADVVVNVSSDLSDLIEGLNATNTKLNDVKKASADTGATISKAFTDTSTKLKGVENALQQVNDLLSKGGSPQVVAQLKAHQQELEKEKQTLQGVAQQTQKVAEAENQMASAVDGNVKKTQSLRAELRSITQQMGQMLLTGQGNTAEFQALSMKAGEMKDAMNDARNTMKNLASDTKYVDGAIQGVQGLVGAFSIFQSVSVLVGKDNKELQETMMKLMATMNLLNGVQQIGNILQKDSALMQSIISIRQKIVTATTVAQTTATGGATIAQRALNLAMSMNPIGVVIAAMTALVGVLYLFSRTNEEAEQTQKQFNETQEKTKKIIEEINQANKDSLTIAKAKGESENDLTLMEIDGIKKKRDELNKANNEAVKGYQNLTDEQKDQLKQNLKQEEDYNKEIHDLRISYQAQQIKANNDAQKAKIDNMKAGKAKEIALENFNYDKKLKAAGNNSALIGEIIKEHENNIAEINKKAAEDWQKTQKEKLKFLKDIELEHEKFRISLIADEYTRNLENYQLEKKLAYEKKQEDLKNLNFTNAEKTKILKEYRDFQLEQEKDFIYKNSQQYKASLKIIEDLKSEDLNIAPVLDLSKMDIIKEPPTDELKNIGKEAGDEMILGFQDALNKGLPIGEAIKWINKEEKLALAKSLTDLSMMAFDTFATIDENALKGLDELINNLDSRISESEKAIEEEEKLAKEGSANNLQLKREELANLKQQQEQAIADRQEQVAKIKQQEEAIAIIKLVAATVIATALAIAEKGWIAGLLESAAGIIAMGLSIAAIKSEAASQAQFEHGTAQVLGGRSHSQGGVNLGVLGEAEQGEFLGILNKKDSQRYAKPLMNLFDGINNNNNNKMIKGLAELNIAIPNEKKDNIIINNKNDDRLLKFFENKEEVSYQGNKKIIKKGNYTRIIYLS